MWWLESAAACRFLVRLVCIGAAGAALAGCFQPLYGERSISSSTSIGPALSAVDVAQIERNEPDRARSIGRGHCGGELRVLLAGDRDRAIAGRREPLGNGEAETAAAARYDDVAHHGPARRTSLPIAVRSRVETKRTATGTL